MNDAIQQPSLWLWATSECLDALMKKKKSSHFKLKWFSDSQTEITERRNPSGALGMFLLKVN